MSTLVVILHGKEMKVNGYASSIGYVIYEKTCDVPKWKVRRHG